MPFTYGISYVRTVILTPASVDHTDVERRSEGGTHGPLEPIRVFLESLFRAAIGTIGTSLCDQRLRRVAT
jgi:hypothetical protein